MTAKKRKATIEDEEIIDETDNDTPDELPEQFDGFPEDGLTVHVYRQQQNKKEAFLDVLTSPVSPMDIKSRFGGGNFMCYVKDEKQRIQKKRMITIEADVSQIQAVPVIQHEKPVTGLRDIADIIDLVAKISENKSSQSEQTSKMMEVMQAGMTAMMTTSMTMMSSNMEMMKRASEMVQENTGGDRGNVGIITDTIKEVSKTLGTYMSLQKATAPARRVATVKTPRGEAVKVLPEKKEEKSAVPSASIIDIINTTYSKSGDDTDGIDFLVEYIDRIYPELAENISGLDEKIIFAELTRQGLSVSEEYFHELYECFKDTGATDTENGGSGGDIPNSTST